MASASELAEIKVKAINGNGIPVSQIQGGRCDLILIAVKIFGSTYSNSLSKIDPCMPEAADYSSSIVCGLTNGAHFARSLV